MLSGDGVKRRKNKAHCCGDQEWRCWLAEEWNATTSNFAAMTSSTNGCCGNEEGHTTMKMAKCNDDGLVVQWRER